MQTHSNVKAFFFDGHFRINMGSLRWRHGGGSMAYQQGMRRIRLQMDRNICSVAAFIFNFVLFDFVI